MLKLSKGELYKNLCKHIYLCKHFVGEFMVSVTSFSLTEYNTQFSFIYM